MQNAKCKKQMHHFATAVVSFSSPPQTQTQTNATATATATPNCFRFLFCFVLFYFVLFCVVLFCFVLFCCAFVLFVLSQKLKNSKTVQVTGHNETDRFDAFYFVGTGPRDFKGLLGSYTYLTGAPFMPPIYGLGLGDRYCIVV